MRRKAVIPLLLLLMTALCGCGRDSAECSAPPQIVEVAQIQHRIGKSVALPLPTNSPTPPPTPTPSPVPTPSPTPAPPCYTDFYVCAEEDLVLAATVAFYEAGGKGEAAYRAVLCVIYNRCMASRFGGGVTTIRQEVYRKGQFSVLNHRDFSKQSPPAEIVEYARDVFVNGNLSIPKNVLFFCAKRLGTGWGGRKLYKNIGGNLFFYGSVD